LQEEKTPEGPNNLIRYMSNPRAFTLRKWFYELLKINYASHDTIIERVSSSLVTERDLEDFGKLIGQVYETGYTTKNQYDNFSVLDNRNPIKEYRLVVMPEYVTLTYSGVIFTNHLEQNNKLIEAFKYAENTYWGEQGRFQFRARIDSFSTSTEYSSGDDRTTRTNFTITLNGYIIPDTVNRDLSYPKKFLSKAQIIFNLETDDTEIFTVGTAIKGKAKPILRQNQNSSGIYKVVISVDVEYVALFNASRSAPTIVSYA
jgi:hypothetical protein